MNISTFKTFKKIQYEKGISIEGEVLKKCQKVLLEIAEDFVTFCEENGFWYQLGGGTALGAVRHHGFIPWDDDIDFNVKGKDFEKIGKGIEKKFGKKYKFLYYDVSDYGLPIGKIMLEDTVFRDRESYDSENCGFFIDIFPIENVPNNRFLRKTHGFFCMIFGGLLSCRKYFRNRNFLLNLVKENPDLEKIVKLKIFIGGTLSFLSLRTCAKFTDRIYGLYKNENSIYVTGPAGRNHYFGEMMRRDGMITTVQMEFEGHKWQIPSDYDTYFTQEYGSDYMTPPSVEKREKHIILELKFPQT